jgi:hypothetical protein
MLHRPPSRPPSSRQKRQRRRERRRLVQQEYRRRYDAGLIVIDVEIDGDDGDVVKLLIATNWLKFADRRSR